MKRQGDKEQIFSREEGELAHVTAAYFRKPGPERFAEVEKLVCGDQAERMRRALIILEIANAALDEETRLVGEVMAGRGQPLVCRPGCFGCCCQLVLCHPFEAALVARHLVAHPSLAAAFAVNFSVWDEATASFRDDYLRWGTRLYQEGIDDGTHRLEEFYVPCPFLDASGRCLIYSVRPCCCRSCVAVDPACAAPSEPGERPGARSTALSLALPHHKARVGIVSLLMDRIDAGPRSVPLPLAVRRFL